MIGIYALKLKNKYYIGSSVNIEKRVLGHINLLRKRLHPNLRLQNDVNMYGIPDYILLETLIKEDKEFMLEREQHYINKYDSLANGYNNTKASKCKPKPEFKPSKYEEEQISKAFLLVNKKPIIDICLETGLTPKMLTNLKSSKHAEWLKEKFKEIYDSTSIPKV